MPTQARPDASELRAFSTCYQVLFVTKSRDGIFGLPPPSREIFFRIFTKPDSFEFPLAAAWRMGLRGPEAISCNSFACTLSIPIGAFFDKPHGQELKFMWFAIGRPLDEQVSGGGHGRVCPDLSV